MDQAARPVIIAASALLVASLVTLGVKAGSGDGDDPVNGDGPVAAGTDNDTTGAPDASDDDNGVGSSIDVLPTAEPDPAPDASDDDSTGSPDTSGDGDGSTSGGQVGGQSQDDLDDMPETGGGLAIALGGAVAAGSAASLRRRR